MRAIRARRSAQRDDHRRSRRDARATCSRRPRDAGLLFPLSLASEGSCTIGGNLSTNAGGTAVLRYGNTRELVLGVEVVLADGRVWDGLRGLRKDNTGYDLKQLFIGSEGTLGIVTAAVLKLFAAPRTRVTALAAIADVAHAVELLRAMKQSARRSRWSGFELISGPRAAPVAQASSDAARSAAGPRLVRAAAGRRQRGGFAARSAGGRRARAAQSRPGRSSTRRSRSRRSRPTRLWALRENISEAQRREGPNIKHDISLPVSAIPAFLDDAGSALLAAFPGARLVVFGHLGDGNLHYNLAAPAGVARRGIPCATRAAANRIVHDLVVAAGGSISAEHGIGQLKRDELVHYKAPLELELMRRIKAALDPAALLNPGKVL